MTIRYSENERHKLHSNRGVFAYIYKRNVLEDFKQKLGKVYQKLPFPLVIIHKQIEQHNFYLSKVRNCRFTCFT